MLKELDMDLLDQAKKDFLAREKLFHKYRPQIRTIAMSVCHRPLNWDNDDELSISLIAFNEAIDTYDKTKGMSFINYVKMIIHHRLVDYFRQEGRFLHASLDALNEENKSNHYEVEQAYNNYKAEERAKTQREMIESYNDALAEYSVSLDDLLKVSPKHRDTKHTLMKIAQILVNEPALLSQLHQYKKLPIKELMILTGISRKVIERGRKYIIALTLILINDEFSPIKQLIRFPQQEGGEW